MNPYMALNGTPLGLASSKCFILERTIDCSKVLSGTVAVDYPSEASRYLIFGRSTNVDQLACLAYVIDGKVQWSHIGQYESGYVFNYKLYVYREIKDTDKVSGTYGLNIYNDNGSLFYSSDKLPLKIKGLRYFSDADIGNLFPPIKTYTDPNCMVLLNTLATSKGDFLRMVYTPSINAYGTLSKSQFFPSHAGGDKDIVFNNYVVVAYAPDLYPRHS